MSLKLSRKFRKFFFDENIEIISNLHVKFYLNFNRTVLSFLLQCFSDKNFLTLLNFFSIQLYTKSLLTAK